MKNFLFFTFLFSCIFFAKAESPSHMVIQCTDGSKITYILSDEPKLTFEGLNMVINSKGINVEHPLSDVIQITYENDNNSSLEKVFIDSSFFSINDGILCVGNDRADFSVSIFDVNGICIINKSFLKTESANIPLNNFTKGIYILLINNISFKFHIK